MSRVESEPDLANWMSQLPDSLLDAPLSALAIPGSHNSFTSTLDRSSDIGPDAAPAVKMLGPLAKGIVYNWSVTQTLDLKSQLLSGVRYLDLRVATKRGSADIYFVHGLYGTTVQDGLKHVLEFVESHKKEIVILDFNHFFDMDESHHTMLLNTLIERLAERLCLFVGIENLTLRTLWDNGLQIIVIYHHKIATDFSQVWHGSSTVTAPWANTVSAPCLLTFLDSAHRKSHDGRLHVCQCVLTPDTGFIMKHMNSTLHKEMGEKLMPDVIKWLETKHRGKCGVNIVTADFVEKENFVKKVILLNFK